jgi:ribosomal protein S13
MKEYSEMTSQEIEDEILKYQAMLSIQEKSLDTVETQICTIEKTLIDLKDSKLKARNNIKETKRDIDNLNNIWKWRSIRREKGLI